MEDFKMLKKQISIIISLVILIISVSPLNTFASRRTEKAVFSSIGITINGKEYNVRPVIINDVSYFPVRTIGYALNCTTQWQSDPKKIILTSQKDPVNEDSFSQSKDGTYGDKTAIFDNEIVLTANGKVIDSPVAIVDDRSYVPVKAVAEAMGKRATWYADTKTIQIVNPDTAKVDDSIKDYYVYDLPEIKNNADYLVGNWRGSSKDKFSVGYTRCMDDEFFISKNSDGTYKVIAKNTITKYTLSSGKEDYSFAGKSAVVELKGYFDPETNYFTTEFVKMIYCDETLGAVGYAPDTFLLKDEILIWLDGGQEADTTGSLERF